MRRRKQAASALASELRRCYATPALRLLSGWWVLGALAGSYCENYGTNLFYEVDPSADENGHVTFVTRSLCCAAALAAIRLEAAAAAAGAGVYAAGTAAAGLALASLAGAATLRAAYASYAAALTVLQFCICVLYAQCAHALDDAAQDDAARDAAAALPAEEARPMSRDAPGGHGGAPRGRVAVLFGANATAALALQTAVQAVAEAARAPTRVQFALLAWCALRIASGRSTTHFLTPRLRPRAAMPSESLRSRRWRPRRCARGSAPGASCAPEPRRRPRLSLARRRGNASWTRCCHRRECDV